MLIGTKRTGHTTTCQKSKNPKSKNRQRQVAGNPKGQGPEKSSEAQDENPQEIHEVRVTTDTVFPITQGSLLHDWAPSLLARPLGQEMLKLGHLLAEHAIQHRLLLVHLLLELFLKGFLRKVCMEAA